MRYVFIYGGTTILWRSIKKIIETCGLPSIKGNVTKLYSVVCIAQINEESTKGDKIIIYCPSSFTFISSRRVMKLLFNK